MIRYCVQCKYYISHSHLVVETTVYSMNEKTQFPGFMFPQVLERHFCQK